jgi:peptidoglycan/xylan/chitin deacetylase (PgdA/CDA1 family)
VGRALPRPLILAYHAVDSGWASTLAVSEQALAAQAAHFRARGYVGLTLSEAERRRAGGTLPPRSVVFTFDDAYASVRRGAAILDRHGFPGTVFVVTSFAGSGEPMRWFGVEDEPTPQMRPLGWDELTGLAERGWEVGSHTVTHPLLTALPHAELEHELKSSRAEIERRLGRCTSLAYPYGVADARVASAAAAAGYAVACSLTGVEMTDEPLRRHRVWIGSADVGLRLRTKVSRPALRLRRTAVARLARAARPRRTWMPSDTR